MKIYTVTLSRPWDGKEIVSTHMTRKGALQVACAESLETLLGCFDEDDKDLAWAEENLKTLYNPERTLTVAELDDMFDYAEKLLWDIENEVEIVWHTLQP